MKSRYTGKRYPCNLYLAHHMGRHFVSFRFICEHPTVGSDEPLKHTVTLNVETWMIACADPGGFVRVGLTLKTFFFLFLIVDDGREDPNVTIRGYHRPASETSANGRNRLITCFSSLLWAAMTWSKYTCIKNLMTAAVLNCRPIVVISLLHPFCKL